MKLLKKLIPLLLSLCLILAVPFAACTKNNNTINNYDFIIKYPDGSFVNGETDSGGNKNTRVCIQLLNSKGEPVTDELTEQNFVFVNASGQAQFKCTPAEYTVSIVNCPHGYNLNTQVKTNAKDSTYTITLESNIVNYSASVVYKDGSPANGVELTMNVGDEQVKATTDASGKATFDEVYAGVYDIVATCPDNYVARTGKTTITADKDVEIVLEPYTMLSLETLMTDDELDKMDDKYNGALFNLFNRDLGSYKFTVDVPEGEEVFFAIMPEYSANYIFYIYSEDYNSTTNYSISLYGDSIDTDNGNLIEYGIGTGRQNVKATADEPFYFSCKTTDGSAKTYDIVITLPDFSREIYPTVDPDTYELTFRTTEQFLSFKPSFSGVYEIYTTGDYDTEIQNCDNSYNPNPEDGDDDSGEGKNFKYTLEVKESYVGNTYYFKLFLRSADDSELELPVNIDLVIERTGNASPDDSVRLETMTTSNTVKFEETGTFVWMPFDGSLIPHQNENGDGYWYVTVGGVEKKLLMAVSKNICLRPDLHKDYAGSSISFATIEYRGESDSSDERQNNNLTVYDDILALTSRKDYSRLIETYSGYSNGKPGATTGLCNSEGLYPVNDELYGFLTRFFAAKLTADNTTRYNANGVTLLSMFVETSYNNPAEVRFGCEWLVACGYYA